MILYHGGFTTVSEPKILKPTRAMDFGQGFYATSSFKQAKDWSLIKKDRFGYEMAVVSEFEFDDQDLSNSSLKCKVFEKADDECSKLISEIEINAVKNSDKAVDAVINGFFT